MVNEITNRSAVGAGSFRGPLFLLGMPRSGTKLLRDMLNQHNRIRFSAVETEFFPFWVSHWAKLGVNGSREDFERFYRRCLRLPFFIENAERGISVDQEAWFSACESWTPAAVFEGLMRCILSVPPQEKTIIWGDKSPSYLRHVPLLAEQFPEAKIIHIVRDVRDCSLSIRKAWGKSILRSAQRWTDDVSKCCEEGRKDPGSYMEVRYEDLLADPSSVLMDICGFIGVDLDERMLSPSTDTENIGDAKGMTTLLATNVNKYRSGMSPSLIARIERIACSTLRTLNYPCAFTGDPVRVPDWQLNILQLSDGFRLLGARMRERGLIEAFRFHASGFKTSGNRVR